MSKKISIRQFLMKSGKFRRVQDCIEAIRNGNVAVNNKILVNPNHFFNPKKSLVKIGNEKTRKAPKLYFLINKPAGYLSQKSEGEKTIYDLIGKLDIPNEHKKSLFAVGRLDKDTEGLLILTNDGVLSDLLANPENKISKKYYAMLEKPADKNKIKTLEKGIEIEVEYNKYKTKPCKIKIVKEKEAYITVSEGKKRQVRKMFEAIGNKIVYLKRVSIAGLQLGKLEAGEIKPITREEIMEKLNS